jgi:IS30 family transposase
MPKALSPETKETIVGLYDAGMRVAEIAQRTGVDRCFIYKLLKWNGRVTRQYREMKISSVARDDYEWLRREATRMGSSVADLARAMLTDAIDEARNGRD